MQANKKPMTVNITENAGWYHVWLDGRLYSMLNEDDILMLFRAYLDQGGGKKLKDLLRDVK